MSVYVCVCVCVSQSVGLPDKTICVVSVNGCQFGLTLFILFRLRWKQRKSG